MNDTLSELQKVRNTLENGRAYAAHCDRSDMVQFDKALAIIDKMVAAEPPIPDWVADFINRRAAVEQEMFNANSATKEQLRAWALRLGIPSQYAKPQPSEPAVDFVKIERAISTLEMAKWEMWEWSAYGLRNHIRLSEGRDWKHADKPQCERTRIRVDQVDDAITELRAMLQAAPQAQDTEVKK